MAEAACADSRSPRGCVGRSKGADVMGALWPPIALRRRSNESGARRYWHARRSPNLFGDEVLTSVKRIIAIDVLKPERQRLELKKPWPRLKLIVDMWSECVSRHPQPSNDLPRDDPLPCFDGDGAWLHVHHDAVLGVSMVDDHAISGKRHNRIMEWPVVIGVRFLSRVRVLRYVIAGVDDGSTRRRKDLAAI